ncbi:calcium-binding protein CML42-like [Impatiens glandulifera]|uniref:calcium-binding protein CML42-like n=1 Tax=Impatiens glandulifera TaxID=253017 RepID=UPI001FB16094|nr:calcium-binding protein CML42-like [Impatiens glandulifera]
MESATDNCKKPSLIGTKSKSTSKSFRLRSSSLNSVRLRRVFDLFDSNHDEIITIDELSQALLRLGLEADLSELSSIVKSQIQPGQIGLDFLDFEILHRSLNDTFFAGLEQGEKEEESGDSKKSQEEVDLSEAFKVFDEDGDGFISANELQTVLGKLGFVEGKEIDGCKKMILSVDSNHDGRVDFREFKVMMRTTVLVNSS